MKQLIINDEAFQPIYKALLMNLGNKKWKEAFNRAKHKLGMATLDIPALYDMARAIHKKPEDFKELLTLIKNV